MKRMEAAISCSPCPRNGKSGDIIQMKTGTEKMRLIVMEFGRFTGQPLREIEGSQLVLP